MKHRDTLLLIDLENLSLGVRQHRERELDPREVVYVHLNDAPVGIHVNDQVDNKRELPGTGVIDLNGFLGALKKIGYDGPVTVEPFNEPLRKLAREDAVKATSASMDKVFRF